MTTHDTKQIASAELSARIDILGWGLLCVALGCVGLVPGWPKDAWLIAAGVVMIAVSLARATLRLPVRGLTTVVGTVALAAGIGSVVGLATATGPIVLIVLGLTLVIGALYRMQRPANLGSLFEER